MIEVRGPGEVVRTLAVACRGSCDGLVDEHRRLRDLRADIGELLVLGRARRRCSDDEREPGDQYRGEGEPSHLAQLLLRLIEIRFDLGDERVDLRLVGSVLHRRAQIGGELLLDLLHQVVVHVAERPLDMLVVLEVDVADVVGRTRMVARRVLGDGVVEQRTDRDDLG